MAGEVCTLPMSGVTWVPWRSWVRQILSHGAADQTHSEYQQ